jgi:hypothetical protein
LTRLAGQKFQPDRTNSRLLIDALFEYRHLQLAQMAFEAIPGTPGGILVLRAMKAQRLGRLLDDQVWDENLMKLTPLELLQRVLRYLLAADIDKGGLRIGFEYCLTLKPGALQ